jgi:hypothetical protein
LESKEVRTGEQKQQQPYEKIPAQYTPGDVHYYGVFKGIVDSDNQYHYNEITAYVSSDRSKLESHHTNTTGTLNQGTYSRNGTKTTDPSTGWVTYQDNSYGITTVTPIETVNIPGSNYPEVESQTKKQPF